MRNTQNLYLDYAIEYDGWKLFSDMNGHFHNEFRGTNIITPTWSLSTCTACMLLSKGMAHPQHMSNNIWAFRRTRLLRVILFFFTAVLLQTTPNLNAQIFCDSSDSYPGNVPSISLEQPLPFLGKTRTWIARQQTLQ